MRIRRVIASLILGAVLAPVAAVLVASTPASAETPPGYMRCEINWITNDGDNIGVDPSGRPFECYY